MRGGVAVIKKAHRAASLGQKPVSPFELRPAREGSRRERSRKERSVLKKPLRRTDRIPVQNFKMRKKQEG